MCKEGWKVMKSWLPAGLAVMLTIPVACADTLAAEIPAAPTASTMPPTLWNFLGLKQCADKCKEHLVLHKEKKAEKQALKGGHPCLKHLFGPLCPCGCLKCELLKKKPPVKPLADPANLESQNPAIKAAAEIKAEEDLAPQKIKAIRYLATIGCRCYPQIKPALLAALDDCTEEVRYEAALAFCRSAGNPCSVCNSSTCCDPDVRKKLSELASGTDDQDCWKEPSPRVRSAAAGALNACEMIAPPETISPPEDEPRELPPPEMAPNESAPETAAAESETPAPLTVAGSPADGNISVIDAPADALRLSASDDQEGDPEGEDAAPAEGHERVSDGIPAITVGRTSGRVPASCSPRPAPSSRQKPGTEPPLDEAEQDRRTSDEVPPQEAELDEEFAAPSSADLAGTFGAASGPQSAAPYMIGDFFGGPACQATIVRSFSFDNLIVQPGPGNTFYTVMQNQEETRVAVHHQSPYPGPTAITGVNDASGQLGGAPLEPVPAGGTLLDGATAGQSIDDIRLYTSQFEMEYVVSVPSPGTGGGAGRMKIAENTSPMPRDRLIFDYGYFDNVPLAPGGANVNRFFLGFEKTFLDGWMSFELKAPMASTVNSTMVQGATVNDRSGEFGNLALAVKTLLMQTETWAISGGLQIGLPTADDTSAVLPDGTPLLTIRNDAVHLGPFFGALWTPNERLFSQGFLQCDVASTGNAVLINHDGCRLSEVGRLNDATLLTLDWGIGYWALRNSCPQHALTGLALTAELHWNRSLQNADSVAAGSWAINCGGDAGSANTGEINVLDLTLGCHLALRQNTIVTCGYAIPMDTGGEQPFDGEFRMMVNHHFGPASRISQPF